MKPAHSVIVAVATHKFANYTAEQCDYAIRDIHNTLSVFNHEANAPYIEKLYAELDAARDRKQYLIGCTRPTVAELVKTIREQHEALDILLVQAIGLDKTFAPSKSPAWAAVVRGSEILKRLAS